MRIFLLRIVLYLKNAVFAYFAVISLASPNPGIIYGGIILAATVALNCYILISGKTVASDETSFFKSIGMFLNLSGFVILGFAIIPEHINHGLWGFCWIGGGIWFFITSPYTLKKHKNRVEYFYNLLQSGIDSGELGQHIPQTIQNRTIRSNLREDIYRHKRFEHAALENYRQHFRDIFVAQPGITAQYADAYLTYNRDTLALMHLNGVAPEKAVQLIIDDLQTRSVQTGISTLRGGAATPLYSTQLIPLIAAPTQSEIDILNDLLLRSSDEHSQTMRSIQAYMTLPSNHNRLSPAEILLKRLVQEGIVQDENNPAHRSLHDLKRIVTLNADGRYRLTDIAALEKLPQQSRKATVPSTLAPQKKMGLFGQSIAFGVFGLFFYGASAIFSVRTELFVATDTWRYIGHGLALPISLITAIWLYPRAYADKTFPQVWGVFSFFIIYFVFWSALVPGVGEVFTEMTSQKEMSVINVSKDPETSRRIGRHGKTTAYCIEHSDFQKSLLQKSFCRLHAAHYDILPDKKAFLFPLSVKKSPLGTLYTGYYWPTKMSPTKENFHAVMNIFLGLAYLRDEQLPRDLEKVNFHFKAAAEKNNADAQFLLAAIYKDENTPLHNQNTARQWLLRAAEQKHLKAMSDVGVFYFNGRLGFEKNMKKSFEWTLPAAQAGDPNAQFLLSVLYGAHKRNIQESVKWAMIAEMNGHEKAPEILAIIKPALIKDIGQKNADTIFTEATDLATAYQKQKEEEKDISSD